MKLCTSHVFFLIFLFISFFSLPVLSWSDDFSADMEVKSQGGMQMPGNSKILMKGKAFRIENPMAVTISRPDKGLVWVIMENQKMYMEQPYSQENQVSQWKPGMKETADKVGKETISGLTCTKYKVKSNEGAVYYWISDKIDFPVKMEGPSGEMVLKNIKIGNVSSKLFELPKGYSKFSMGNMMPGGIQFGN